MADFGAVVPAWKTARLIAAAKWRTVRSPGSRAWMWVAYLLGAGAVSIAAQAGDLIRIVAEIEGDQSAVGVAALTYIRQWAVAGFGTMTSAILAFALGAALVSALVSSSAPSLMPAHQLVGVRTSSMHPYVSALAVQLTSLVTFIQLLALTALAGLLTIDGVSRSRAVLLVWAAWVSLLTVSQAALWGSRVARRRSVRATGWSVCALAGVAALAVTVAPSAAKGLFGGTAAFAWWLLDAPVAVSVAAAAALILTAWWAGWAWCASTVHANAVTAPQRGTDRVTRPVPAHPTRALAVVVIRSFLRTRSISTPLLVVAVLSAAGVAAAGDQKTVVWSVGVGVPLAVGLAWTDNAAAMTGPANPWLASLPGQGSRLLGVWAGWAWTVSVGLVMASWAPAAALGRVSWSSTGSVLVTAVAASSTVTVAALWHAVHRPTPARTDLGDGLLSASQAATASLRLLVVPGLVAWLATSGSVSFTDSPMPVQVQALGAACCALASLGVGAVVAYRWSDPRTRALCLTRSS